MDILGEENLYYMFKLFKIEKFFLYFIFCVMMRQDLALLSSALGIGLFIIIIYKFEDSIRKEYNDSNKDKLNRLLRGEELDESVDD